MSRLELIYAINPEWSITITKFMEEYPEFKPFINIVPINPIVPIPYENINNLFQAIMHYICAVGVRYTYALNQWKIIYPLIDCEDWQTILENTINLKNNLAIQNKKRDIYYNLCNFMQQNNLNHRNLNVSHLDLLRKNISGIGDGCIAWCKKYFTTDDNCIEYTDIYFKKGFLKLYNSDSLASRKQKAKEWLGKGFGRISNLMVLRIGAYT